MKPCTAWGVMWRSRPKLEGLIEFLMWRNHALVLFATKKAAQAWIKQEYGYIATRKDLRKQPFGWMTPRAVRVEVVLSKGSHSRQWTGCPDPAPQRKRPPEHRRSF